MAEVSTRTLQVPGATITYYVRDPLRQSPRRPLLIIGQPMDASGFGTLASHFNDRTVVTYDPRGLGSSSRDDGRTDHDPVTQAEDLHALIDELGLGPVDVFASSGGGMAGMALVTAYPDSVATLVVHEPPVFSLLPDADRVFAAERAMVQAYHEGGLGAGMAQFIVLSSWQGELTDEYEALPTPDPTAYGMPAEDDGSRDNPLLSGASGPVTGYEPDLQALGAASTRIVVGGGIETIGQLTGRTAAGLAEALSEPLVIFPGGHTGFLGGEYGHSGEPEAFAGMLREVLDGDGNPSAM